MNRKMTAILMVVCMMVAYVPIAGGSGQVVATAGAGNTPVAYDDGDGFVMEEVDDGTFMFTSNYVNEMFGVKNPSPSEVDNPFGDDALGVAPQEIVYWQGGSNSRFIVHETGETKVIRDDQTGLNTDSYHSTSFSAQLTAGNDGRFGGYTGSSHWNEVGFHLLDWYCSLFYDNNTGALMLAVSNGEDSDVVSVDSLAGTGPYSPKDINIVSSLQSRNILNYSVGDFNGDRNDEIAIAHQWGIYIFGLDQTNLEIVLMGKAEVPRIGGSDNTLYTPVSMASGDIDSDGMDELLITRGYYQSGIAGNMEFTNLGILDVDDRGRVTSDWIRVTMTDPKNNASVLDSVMTSVTVGDIDSDLVNEIVLGGFLWDNTNTSRSYTEDWARSAGELYLTYIEPTDISRGDVRFRGLTILGDDNGTATTRFVDGNKSWSNHYKLNSHNRADTSIYLTDNNDNPTGLCRSVNWCNWTVPLFAGSINGIHNGYVVDQVYFDKWFYGLVGNGFVVHAQNPQLGYVIDDNNIVCNGVDIGQILGDNGKEYTGKDQFLLFYGADLEKSTDKGRTEWVYVIYSEGTPGSNITDAKYSTDYGYRDLRDWGDNGLYNVGRVFAGNYDYDTFYVKLIGHLYVFSDPEIITVLAPVPYDSNIAGALRSGSGAFGTTTFSKYTSHTDETTSTFTYDLGFSLGQDKKPSGKNKGFNAGFSIGFKGDSGWSNSQTVTISTSYSSPNGAVAALIVPLDIYMYEVHDPREDGTYDNYKQTIPFASAPMVSMFGYDGYNLMVDTYNAMLKDYDSNMMELEKIPVADNTAGDLSSYYRQPNVSALLHDPIEINSHGGGIDTTTVYTVDMSSSKTEWNSHGAFFNLQLLFGGFGFKVDADYTYTHSETDLSGLSFSTTLNNGFAWLYQGESHEAQSVLSQYTMRGTMWAEERHITLGGEDQRYVYVGYTVTDHTTVPAWGKLAGDMRILDEDDDDDPYNPTNDAVFMKVTLPEASLRDTGDRYMVQMRWNSNWYDLSVVANKLGMPSYAGDVENGWEHTTGTFTPVWGEEFSTWIKVTGLSHYTNTEFQFRIVAEKTDHTGMTFINPALAITCYKDTHIADMDMPMLMMPSIRPPQNEGPFEIYNGVDILFDERAVYDVDGVVFMIIKTDLEMGDRINLWYQTDDGEYHLVAQGLTVFEDGYVAYEFSHPDDPLIDDAGTGLVIVALMVLIGTMMALAYNRV